MTMMSDDGDDPSLKSNCDHTVERHTHISDIQNNNVRVGRAHEM